MSLLSYLNDWTNVVAKGRNDLVFEKRNKAYGAYDLRKNYNKYTFRALMISASVVFLAMSSPKIIELFKGTAAEERVVPINDTLIVLDVPPPPEDAPPPPPPPPPVLTTIRYVPPVVVDEEVPDEKIPVQQEEPVNVSTVTQEGTGDEEIIVPEPVSNGVVDTKEEIFTVVEQMPSFAGGDGELMKFIQKNIVYPAIEKEAGISGTAYVTFVVDKEGKITDVKILRGVSGGPNCDKEAMRVVKAMPPWKPGKQNGRPVSVQYNLPIKFVLR